MDAVVFYLFYIINWFFALLPLRVLYLFSGFLYIILYYFPGYRRKVVFTNLSNAFPEKPVEELRQIEKKFYRHLTDIFIEISKMTHMSRRELRKRMVFENPELLIKLYNEGKDIVGVLGHYNNWEWMNLITETSDYTFMSVFKPIKNIYFDRFMNSLRSKNGVVLTPMSMVIRDIISYRKKGIFTLSAYLADQAPAKFEIHYWTTFLNQETSVYLGPEKIAAKYNMAVIYFNVQKVKRGYYKATMELICDNAAVLPENNLTEIHVKRLEEIIRQKPEYWIWSHRRWKHRKELQNG